MARLFKPDALCVSWIGGSGIRGRLGFEIYFRPFQRSLLAFWRVRSGPLIRTQSDVRVEFARREDFAGFAPPSGRYPGKCILISA